MSLRLFGFISSLVVARTRRGVLLVLAAFLFMTPSYAETYTSAEYDIKAAYLYHFLNFIRWPAQSSFHTSEDINICILGENPFGDKLERISRRAVEGKAIAVYLIEKAADVDQCHLVFISGRKRPFSDNILKKLIEKQVLSVGENEYFVKAGGMIALTYEKGRISCLINLRAGRDAGFHFSAQLLEVSTIVVNDYR